MSQSIAINQLNHALVASIQIDLTESALREFNHELLTKLQSTRAKGVLIDLSDVRTFEPQDFLRLLDVAKTVCVMGRRCLFVGLRPGVVIGLVNLGLDLPELRCVANLDDGLSQIKDDSLW
ncbi:STAS domain-containing protein [Vibrio sp. TRT 21S02]|uniref:STAS domain-containing protein n=1 Tax=unclassified Vibrio TaxID=2614977 RepID=UPI00349F3E4C